MTDQAAIDQRWQRYRELAEPIYQHVLARVGEVAGDEVDHQRIVDILATALRMQCPPAEAPRKPLVLAPVGLTDEETQALATLEQAVADLGKSPGLASRVSAGIGELIAEYVEKRDVPVPRCPKCGSTELDYEEDCVDMRGVDSINLEGQLIVVGGSTMGDGDSDPGLHCAACGQMVEPPEGWDIEWL